MRDFGAFVGIFLRGWVHFLIIKYSVFSLLYLFAAKYTSALTHLHHYGVGILRGESIKVAKYMVDKE